MMLNTSLSKLIVALFAGLVLGVSAGPAQATPLDPDSDIKSGWRICNQTPYGVWLAHSIFEAGTWTTKGWEYVSGKSCFVVQDRLTNRYAYYYADRAHTSYSGELNLCVDMMIDFTYTDKLESCPISSVKFIEVDFDGRQSHTIDLN
ncbi:MAG: DUF1036 domain-containing protein [Pseudomonadota bacterium]